MSYPSPNTEASSGERGDLVVANSRNPVSQALGIPPRRLSLQPDTDVSQKQYSPKTKVQGKCTLNVINFMIVHYRYTL